MITVALITEIIRLINNFIEGTPIEQRKAQALVWFSMWFPIFRRFLPDEAVKQIDAVMASAKVA